MPSPPYLLARVDQFMGEYTRQLTDARRRTPERYRWRADQTVETFTANVRAAILAGGIHACTLGEAMKATAKVLNVRPTYRGLDRWFKGEGD